MFRPYVAEFKGGVRERSVLERTVKFLKEVMQCQKTVNIRSAGIAVRTIGLQIRNLRRSTEAQLVKFYRVPLYPFLSSLTVDRSPLPLVHCYGSYGPCCNYTESQDGYVNSVHKLGLSCYSGSYKELIDKWQVRN